MPEENKPKRKEAAALQYDPEKGAPRVVASGKGAVAENIIKTAKENAIPIFEDPDLARTLNAIRLGDEIPSELYNVVAQILVFVGDVDKKAYGRTI